MSEVLSPSLHQGQEGPAFIAIGYRNWKHATDFKKGFPKHVASKEGLLWGKNKNISWRKSGNNFAISSQTSTTVIILAFLN